MRRLKTRLHKVYLFIKNISKISKKKDEVKRFFGADNIVFNSFGGADINFLIKKNRRTFAMMRLAITDKKDTNSFPIQRFEIKKRIAYEKRAYKYGGTLGITPKLLYFCDECTVCEYIEGKSAYNIIKKDPSKGWELLAELFPLYHRLHCENIVHLDATLKNIFFDTKINQFKLVDFEYYPNSTVTLKQQKLYDYLKLLEYTLRFIPQKEQENYDIFLPILDCVLKDYRNEDMSLLCLTIKNLENFPIFKFIKNRYNITL